MRSIRAKLLAHYTVPLMQQTGQAGDRASGSQVRGKKMDVSPTR